MSQTGKKLVVVLKTPLMFFPHVAIQKWNIPQSEPLKRKLENNITVCLEVHHESTHHWHSLWTVDTGLFPEHLVLMSVGWWSVAMCLNRLGVLIFVPQ